MRTAGSVRPALAWGLSIALLIAPIAGCEWSRDRDSAHVPPEGKGSIVVDNLTWSDIQVYVDGEYLDLVPEDRNRAIDLDPGLYRIVLREDGGTRLFRSDVDVLAGRLTVLRVMISPDDSAVFEVTMRVE